MSMETNQIAKHATDIMRHSNLFQLCDFVTITCLALFLILLPKIIHVFHLRAFNHLMQNIKFACITGVSMSCAQIKYMPLILNENYLSSLSVYNN